MVSIIVPVYNVIDYIQYCLDSIVSQTLKDIEVIVVDDGSTDGSGAFVDNYASKYPNIIRVFHKENGGLMSAWTMGVRESKGEYIGFVDSDDRIIPTMYEQLLKASIDNDADIVWCDYIADAPNSKYGSNFRCGLYEGADMDFLKRYIYPIPGHDILSNARWNKLYKRHIIIDNLCYTKCLSRTFEDRYIVPAAILSSNRLYYIKEPMYIYTVGRVGCNSKKYKKDLWQEIMRMYMIQQQMLKDKGLFDTYKEYWEKSHLNFIMDYIRRNIVGIDSFKKRLESAHVIINDNHCKYTIEKYGDELKGNLGFLIKWSYRLKSSYCMALLSYISR